MPAQPARPARPPANAAEGQQRRLQRRGILYLLGGIFMLGCFTSSATAWSDGFLVKPPIMRYEHQTFVIKTVAVYNKPAFDSLYVYTMHVTDRLGDAMLTKDASVATKASLEIGTDADGGLRGFYNVKFSSPCATSEMVPRKGVTGHFSGLQPVSINIGSHAPTHRNAFYFDYNDLLWTDMVDPDKPSGFESWAACIVDRPDPYKPTAKAIRLFYRPTSYRGRYPRECEPVKLIRVPRD